MLREIDEAKAASRPVLTCGYSWAQNTDRYCGTYNGYAIVANVTVVTIAKIEMIGNESFKTGKYYFEAYSFETKELYSLKEVYEKNLINDKELAVISEVQREFNIGNGYYDVICFDWTRWYGTWFGYNIFFTDLENGEYTEI